MTQLEHARRGRLTDEMRYVAAVEGIEPEDLRDAIAAGRAIIPKNVHHDFNPIGVGEGLATKVNANIGTSGHHQDASEELRKLEMAVRCGAEMVMDLSTGDDLDGVRRTLLAACPVVLGTVPIYQAVADRGSVFDLSADDLFGVIERHAKDGVDFVTVHCGVTRDAVRRLDGSTRIAGIVSRGGSMLASWIARRNEENPLYAQFDRLLDIAFEHDVTLSLGDGIRPGATADATDGAQIQELLTLGELALRARQRGVQVMIEGPGHVPIDQIVANVQLEKRICHGAPFYVLGPLTSDVGAGYDHITGAIGGAVASAAGADVLCYLTPAEHLRLPTLEDVRDGVIATKIAAHSGDIAKGVFWSRERDAQMSVYRKRLDWEGQYRLALDPEKARSFRIESEDYDKAVCTMCGTLCSMALENARSKVGDLLVPAPEQAGHRLVRVGSPEYRKSLPA
ncbi:MAG TPA: phosphomethylpyrimidine synthase ThiC [Candidatus Polarisedimenticolia bacterium]|jgi:phosphomethylpyrimidine synthase|nr:phosphomethylpyrimidine synthase ThiC [Candidatus Polarisedimenticolia bacterium]